jgi:tetratricopeptide (TPR) repeat protein
MADLGSAYEQRFKRLGSPDDLELAIAYTRRALSLARTDGDVTTFKANLAKSLWTAYLRSESLSDLTEAISLGRESSEAVSQTDPDYPRILVNLAAAIGSLYEQSGRLTDLNEAISFLRSAEAAVDDKSQDWATVGSNLGNALKLRFEWTGESSDILEATTYCRRAVVPGATKHADYAYHLSVLSSVLGALYVWNKHPDILNESIGYGLAAIDEAVSVSRSDTAAYRSNLGVSLHLRYTLAQTQDDLDLAIAFVREAIADTDTTDRSYIIYQSNLGSWLLTRFNAEGSRDDIDDAISATELAVNGSPAGHPNRARYLATLGTARCARFGLDGNIIDAEEALAAWRRAAEQTTAATAVRMTAGQSMGSFAAAQGLWSLASEGYGLAVGLFPRLMWHGAQRLSHEETLVNWAGLASDAAACAIAAGDLELAVEMLETGRGILWSQAANLRTDLDDLRSSRPDLAIRLETARAALDRPVDQRARISIDRQMSAADELDGVLNEIRTVPGFQTFWSSPQFEQLQPGSLGGPIIIVNVSEWRCDSIILEDDRLRVIELSGLTRHETTAYVNDYLLALQRFEGDETGWTIDRLEAEILTVLEWMWDAFADDILKVLLRGDEVSTSAPKRVWWCPTGPLAVVPLHAAGYHRDDTFGNRTVIDNVVSSYTPTVRVLADREMSVAPLVDGHMVLVAVPNTPDYQPLTGIDIEKRVLAGLFPADADGFLIDGNATRSAVLEAIGGSAWLHAACHAHQDLGNPSTGGLVPYDWETAGLVSVADMSGIRSVGQFAFLSACKTAVGGLANADEALTFAAGLQYSGWKHVIATLWSVWDSAAGELSELFYPSVTTDHRLDINATAQGLHDAILEYRNRDSNRVQPSRWAPFVHFGP